MSAEARCNSSATANATYRHGHTGRKLTGAKDVAFANGWASLADRGSLLAHSGSEHFREMVASAKRVDCDALQLFRGQGVPDTETKPPSIDRMGPPRPGTTPREGRYHRAGERIFYLTESEDGARREVDASQGELYLIRILLPLASIRVADFTDLPPDHFVTAVFTKAEICNLTERGGPANYIFSQVVGELVAANWDGMRIPGVRGEPGTHYTNVVLFRRFDAWRNWLEPGSGPYPVDLCR